METNAVGLEVVEAQNQYASLHVRLALITRARVKFEEYVEWCGPRGNSRLTTVAENLRLLKKKKNDNEVEENSIDRYHNLKNSSYIILDLCDIWLDSTTVSFKSSGWPPYSYIFLWDLAKDFSVKSSN